MVSGLMAENPVNPFFSVPVETRALLPPVWQNKAGNHLA